MIDFATILPGMKEGKYPKAAKPAIVDCRSMTGRFKNIFNVDCLQQNITEIFGRSGFSESNGTGSEGRIIDTGDLLTGGSDEDAKEIKRSKDAVFQMAAFLLLLNPPEKNDVDAGNPGFLNDSDPVKRMSMVLSGTIKNRLIEKVSNLFTDLQEPNDSGKSSENFGSVNLKSILRDDILDLVKSSEPNNNLQPFTLIKNHSSVNTISPDTRIEGDAVNYEFSFQPLIERAISKTDCDELVIREGDIRIEDIRVEDMHKPDREIILDKRITGEIDRVTGLFVKRLVDEFGRDIRPMESNFNPDSIIGTAVRGLKVETVDKGPWIISRKANSIAAKYAEKVEKEKSYPDRRILGIERNVTVGDYSKSGKAFFSVNQASAYTKTDVAYQISGKINIKEGETLREIELKLEPESLGTIKIKIASQDNKINVWIKSNLLHTNEIIHESISILKNNLIEKGMEIGEISISVDPNGSGGEKGSQGDFPGYQQGTINKNWYNQKSTTDDDLRAGVMESYQGLSAASRYLNIIV